MNERKRLFFALWPNELTRQKCVDITQGFNKGAVSLVIPASLHVTLLFLGYVSAEQEIVVKQEAASIQVPKISLCFDQLSFWKTPGVLCLTTTDNSQEIIRLVNGLTSLAKKCNIVADKRPYKPHVTLAKKAKDYCLQEFEPIVWYAESFCLVESIIDANKPEYRIIQEWGFQ